MSDEEYDDYSEEEKKSTLRPSQYDQQSKYDQQPDKICKVTNYKCSRYGCYNKFYLGPKDIIRCPTCGYRILDKLRTLNNITYKTE